jgi:hypothetical protein
MGVIQGRDRRFLGQAHDSLPSSPTKGILRRV